MPKYYGDSVENMHRVLDSIRDSKCSFLVAGRLMDGHFRSGREVDAPWGYEGAQRPASLQPSCSALPTTSCGRLVTPPDPVRPAGLFRPLPDFRVDISSTECAPAVCRTGCALDSLIVHPSHS